MGVVKFITEINWWVMEQVNDRGIPIATYVAVDKLNYVGNQSMNTWLKV